MTLLHIRDLTLTIGATDILHDVDVQLQRGEIVAITGESGSGKSMTALSIMGLLPRGARSSGQILLDGTDILTTSEPDLCKMRGNDLVFAFPSLVIAILITAIFGPSAINAIIAIGIFNIPVFARLSRGAALPIWERDFILAARVAGKSSLHISIEHILPNITNLMIVQGTIQFSLGNLAEAALSYIGLGAQPPTASWWRMLADAQTLTSIAPHTALIPGMAIVLMVLGLNLLGDGLRDWLDPRIRIART